MPKSLVLHEDSFYEYFKPYRHPKARHDIWGGHGLETFGEDLELVRQIDPAYLWTVVDGDRDQWIVPGFHYVNRVCYLVTEQAHKDAAMEFRVCRRQHSLTPLGLRRRVNQISRIIGTAAYE